MLERLQNTFASLRARGEKALLAYLMAGDPSLSATRRLVPALAQAGVDAVELGLPFSDPLADGPVIQAAAGRALASGTRAGDVLALVQDLRRETELPLIAMGYYNPLLAYGVDRFCRDAAAAGLDALIVPDLPPEENAGLRRAAAAAGLGYVPLVAPTTPPERLPLVCGQSTAFVYCVSVTGVTGARQSLPEDVPPYLARVREAAAGPVCVGFGVSSPEQVRRLAALADGVIVGSALVRLVEGYGNAPQSTLEEVAALARRLKDATRAG